MRAWLRDFSRRRRRWAGGGRRAATKARKTGWAVNNKRIHHLGRAEGLRVPYRKKNARYAASGSLSAHFAHPAQRGLGAESTGERDNS